VYDYDSTAVYEEFATEVADSVYDDSSPPDQQVDFEDANSIYVRKNLPEIFLWESIDGSVKSTKTSQVHF
jgi:uncharacterized protein YozE (UPF0346 family)